MPWYKRMHRSVKKFWDENLRPTLEPVIKAIVVNKVTKEVNRHKDK